MSAAVPQITLLQDRVRLEGELTIYNVAAVAGELLAGWNAHGPMVVDVGGVQQIDCAGLQLLLTLKQHMRQAGGDMQIVHTSAPVQVVLDLCHLTACLDSTEAA
jgi:anti-sigma B factor antagonist